MRLNDYEDDGSHDYLKNILTVHMTDQQLYSRFGYEVRAKVAITEPTRTPKTPYNNYQQFMLRNMMYLSDHIQR